LYGSRADTSAAASFPITLPLLKSMFE
jgi:hypothetical protein